MTATDDLNVLDIPDGTYTGQHGWIGMVRSDTLALIASTFPAQPPGAWFANPFLHEPTPLTVDDNGRVYGHIATWHTSHIGLAGGIKPPRSKTNYAFFATGALKTDEGKVVNVGQLTLAGGHASLDASVSEAVAHYDDTASAFADVSVGEDKVGIWVAGALRPDVDEGRLRSIRASSVSGDWRPISGNLELVAVCAVNVPGFPVPRARVASGATLALVAAGTEELVRAAVMDRAGADIAGGIEEGLGIMNERLSTVEAVLLDRAIDRRVELDGQDQDSVEEAARKESLRQRVRPPTEASASPDLDALRARVHGIEPVPWDDGAPIELTIAEATTAALRARVHGGTQAAGGPRFDAATRRKMAGRGSALSDGSFPIANCNDVSNAVRAIGRSNHPASKIRAHILKRARSLNCMSNIPDSWNTSTPNTGP